MRNQELFKKVRELEITTRGLVNQVFSGEYHSVFKGRGMEFSEVREYQIGDDIRNIDWNVTARLGHPFIKVFEEERELTLMLLIDMSGSQDFGSKKKTKREIAAEISAILSFSALKNNDKVGCIIFTDVIEKFIPPGKKKTHILRIIREILSFEPTHKGTSINGALEYLNSVIKKRSIVFVVSDFMDKGYEQNMRIVGRKHDLVGIVLNDEREKDFPASGFIKFVDPETGKTRFMDTSDPQFKRLFQFRLADDMADMKRSFSASKLDSVTISTPDVMDDFSYIKPLIQFFKQRAKRW